MYGITPGLQGVVTVPTAIAVFAHQFISDSTPREWAERLYTIAQWTETPRRAHFAAMEEPELLARDIVAFFAARRRGQMGAAAWRVWTRCHCARGKLAFC